MGGKSKHASKYPFLSAVAGGITGAIEISITFPTEYLKTVMQLNPDKNKMGMLNVLKDTVKTHGPLGLYRGYTALLLFSVPKNYVRFGSNELAKKHLFTNGNKLDTVMAGLMAGACEAILVVTPQETLKTKLIHDKLSPNPRYNGLFHGISTIWKEHGFGGVYKGVVPTVLKQSTNQATRFFVHSELKREFAPYIKNAMLLDFIAGGLAGFASVLVNNPIDVVKTIMQGMESHKYKGSLDCFSTVLRNEGVKGFYKGVAPRLIRVGLDVALTFTIFNQMNDMLIEYYVKSKGIKE